MNRPDAFRVKRNLAPWLSVVAILLVGMPTIEYFHRLIAEKTEQLHRIEALGVLSQLRAQVETEINSVLFLTRGLISYIAVNPESTPDEWQAMAAEVTRSSQHVRSIGLAPDNVIRFVYPLEGNEAALGLDYRQTPSQWPAVERAIDIGSTVMAGPLDLVQGGRGLIARTPIQARPDPGGDPFYWGLASVVIDADSLFKAAGIRDQVGHYEIGIIGRDGLGAEGALILGSQQVFDEGIALLPVVFPNGHWLLSARPREVVDPFWDGYLLIRLVGYLTLVVLAVLLATLIRLYQRSRVEAMHDPLTGLPNRRLLMERLTQLASMHQRTGVGFALYFIDMNSFKPVNDEYGHVAGDAVLQEVGRRLRVGVRSSDTVARTGGDEFMLLQPSVGSDDAARAVIAKMERVLAEPFVYQMQELRLSAAIGYAIYPKETSQIDKLIMLADDRMFERKANSKMGKGV